MSFKLNNLGGTIMYRNQPIVRFKFEKDILQMVEYIGASVRPQPFEFENKVILEDRDIRNFFKYRITPSTRIGIDEALAKTPIRFYDAERLIRYQKGRCCADAFWLEPDEDYRCWEEVGSYDRFVDSQKSY